MKKISLAVALTLSVVLFWSCGSKQQVQKAGNTPFGTQITLSECQKMAYSKPATRAWGDATHNQLAWAHRYAEMQARAQMANAISSAVTSAFEGNDVLYNQFAADDKKGMSVTDTEGKNNGYVQQLAQEVVDNAVVIHSEQYQQPNRMYHVFVCLEYQGEVGDIANKITDNLKQKISQKERDKMNKEFNDFRNRIEQQLKDRKAE